jgi:hypothetical protein
MRPKETLCIGTKTTCSSDSPFVTYHKRLDLLPDFYDIWYRRSSEQLSSKSEFRKNWPSDLNTSFKNVHVFIPSLYIQGDQKVSVHLMITIQKVTSNVQSVPRPSPIHLLTHRTVFSIARSTFRTYSVMAIFNSSIVWGLFVRWTETLWSPCVSYPIFAKLYMEFVHALLLALVDLVKIFDVEISKISPSIFYIFLPIRKTFGTGKVHENLMQYCEFCKGRRRGIAHDLWWNQQRNAIHVRAWTGPEVARRLRVTFIMTISTWSW